MKTVVIVRSLGANGPTPFDTMGKYIVSTHSGISNYLLDFPFWKGNNKVYFPSDILC